MTTNDEGTKPSSAPSSHPGPSPEVSKARDELFEAIDHFKSAASILFQRAARDPALKNAGEEAERIVQKLGAAAEPLAKQLSGELAKLTKTVTDAVDGRRKSDMPPPSSKES